MDTKIKTLYTGRTYGWDESYWGFAELESCSADRVEHARSIGSGGRMMPDWALCDQEAADAYLVGLADFAFSLGYSGKRMPHSLSGSSIAVSAFGEGREEASADLAEWMSGARDRWLGRHEA